MKIGYPPEQLTVDIAKMRSRAGRATESHFAVLNTKINELVQLNQWGPYSYSRDELVEMLDQALAGGASSF